MWKKQISTWVWNAQYPNASLDIQQSIPSTILPISPVQLHQWIIINAILKQTFCSTTTYNSIATIVKIGGEYCCAQNLAQAWRHLVVRAREISTQGEGSLSLVQLSINFKLSCRKKGNKSCVFQNRFWCLDGGTGWLMDGVWVEHGWCMGWWRVFIVVAVVISWMVSR